MQAITALVAFLGSGYALLKKPERALAAFMVCLFLYPLPLVIPIGPADFNVSRIVIMAVLACAILKGKLREYRLHIIDVFVILEFIGRNVALTQNVDPSIFLVRESGWFFDTVLPYAAARLILTNRESLYIFFKTFIVLAIIMAPFGLVEALTGFNVTSLFGHFYAWGSKMITSGGQDMRMGLYRSSFTFGVHIIWGLYFAAVAPFCIGLYKIADTKTKPYLIFAFIMCVIGLISSMSTSPMYSLVFSLMMISVYRFRGAWPAMTVAVIAIIMFLEMYSNRHFYEIGTRLALEAQTASYRIGLINEALVDGGMDDHWIFGYGYVGIGPGNDNTNFDWFFIDLVNIYIGKLARFGLVGVLPFIAANIMYYRCLYVAAKSTKDESMWWLIWCISAVLVGWNIAMMTVGALGKVETMLYMLIGMCANLPLVVRRIGEARAPVRSSSPAPVMVGEMLPAGAAFRPRRSRREVLAARRPFRRPYRRPNLEGHNA